MLTFVTGALAGLSIVSRDFLSSADALRFWTPLTICYTLLVVYMHGEKEDGWRLARHCTMRWPVQTQGFYWGGSGVIFGQLVLGGRVVYVSISIHCKLGGVRVPHGVFWDATYLLGEGYPRIYICC